MTTEHKNVFPELALSHHLFDGYIREAIGINYLGSIGHDQSDRRALMDGQDFGSFFGELNWVDVALSEDGVTSLIARGHTDVVNLWHKEVVPILFGLARDRFHP